MRAAVVVSCLLFLSLILISSLLLILKFVRIFSLKKAKETIRSLRFQLSQAEEKLFSKTGGARHNAGNNSARGTRDQQGHLAEDWANIRDKNEGVYD